jgi:hypothetical protein
LSSYLHHGGKSDQHFDPLQDIPKDELLIENQMLLLEQAKEEDATSKAITASFIHK